MQLLPQHTGDLQDKSQAQMHRKSLAASGRLSAVAAGLCCAAQLLQAAPGVWGHPETPQHS